MQSSRAPSRDTPEGDAHAGKGRFPIGAAAVGARGYCFGEAWERPGLSKRDRSLITVATLVALYRTNELPGHLKRALDSGVTQDELIELITHLGAVYSATKTARCARDLRRR